MNGKNKCKILKEIRRRIAEANDIEYVTRECEFRGECKGTCPACEAEVRYLESAINKRKQTGKRVVLAGVAACVMLSAAGCGEAPQSPDTAKTTAATATCTTATPEEYVLDGDVVVGEVPFEEVPDGLVPLEGEPTWPQDIVVEDLNGVVVTP